VSDHDDLLTLATASIYIDDLVAGVEGEFEITGGWGSDEQTFTDALAEVHKAQGTLVANGWRRNKEKEKKAPYSHNIEVACYSKQLKPGQKSRWIYVTVATRFGLHAKFTGGTWESLSW
jgi:hypothetical protein